MRVFLLRDMGAVGAENGFLKELKRYRFVAITLIPMNLALSGITLYIVGFGYGMRHHYITTIALAAYTFFSLTMSIIAAVKYRRYNSPLYSATKAVGLVSSAVSMLTLETAMLAAFGSAGEEQFRRIITALTGAAVFIFTLAVSIYMLSRASKEFKRIKTESNG